MTYICFNILRALAVLEYVQIEERPVAAILGKGVSIKFPSAEDLVSPAAKIASHDIYAHDESSPRLGGRFFSRRPGPLRLI